MHGEATLWGGSLQLAKYIDTIGLATPTAELPTPRPTVVELGAGCGLASMTAAVSGEQWLDGPQSHGPSQ